MPEKIEVYRCDICKSGILKVVGEYQGQKSIILQHQCNNIECSTIYFNLDGEWLTDTYTLK